MSNVHNTQMIDKTNNNSYFLRKNTLYPGIQQIYFLSKEKKGIVFNYFIQQGGEGIVKIILKRIFFYFKDPEQLCFIVILYVLSYRFKFLHQDFYKKKEVMGLISGMVIPRRIRQCIIICIIRFKSKQVEYSLFYFIL